MSQLSESGLIWDPFKKKKTSQQPMLTPEQQAAMAALSGYMNTGSMGGMSYQYGNYDPTDMENMGLSSLQQLLEGGIPEQYRMGDEALKGLLSNDPNAIRAQFDPYRVQMERSMSESDRALKRSSGALGNLYSTDTVRGLGDIRARGNETMSSQLASLTNEALNRKLAAIPLAYQSAESRQANTLGRVGASQTYGSLIRNLNNAAVQDRNNALQSRIGAAGSLVGANVNYGVPSVSTSPYEQLLGLVGQIGGQYLGNEMFLNQAARRR